MSGTVVDSSGAAIPKATVMIRNAATGVSQSTTTNETGFYVFHSLLSGQYSETVQASGYSDLTTSSFEVSTGQRENIPVELKVGSVAETVDVNAAAQLMNYNDVRPGHHHQQRKSRQPAAQ